MTLQKNVREIFTGYLPLIPFKMHHLQSFSIFLEIFVIIASDILKFEDIEVDKIRENFHHYPLGCQNN